MKSRLLTTIEGIDIQKNDLPFAVYRSVKEQQLLNVPVAKPLLIVVLNGTKKLGQNAELICHVGDFIFLPDSPAIDMRNIPKANDYFALLIEFDYADFQGLQNNVINPKNYYIGKMDLALEQCLQQFVEIVRWAPEHLWSARKREIIELLNHLGHSEILSLLSSPKLKTQLHDIFIAQGFQNLTTVEICAQLGMSESTLRRRLKQEGTSVQAVKDTARLGLGFHLIQTSQQPIGLIAEVCGYQSQSRFTDRFKQRFGLTPSELRATK